MHIVSAFSGTGKSTLIKTFPQVSDSDSSQFDKAEFPGNYLRHICDRNRRGLPTLVSTHREVRDGLVAQGVPFVLVYPTGDQLGDYVERYKGRAGTGGLMHENEDWFADLMAKNWDAWIRDCMSQTDCIHRVLMKGEYLSDVIGFESGQFKLLR